MATPSTPLPRRVALAGGAAALAIASLAGCGASGSSDGGGDRSTTTADGGSGGSTTTTASSSTTSGSSTTTARPATEGDLVGTWTADAGSILGANLANLGRSGRFSCSGPVTLTFAENGTFTHRSQATCSAGSVSATATIDSSGRYRADGTTLRILAARDQGTIEVMGRSQPFRAGLAVGSVPYEISGDTLTITFTAARVGTVSQTYTRS